MTVLLVTLVLFDSIVLKLTFLVIFRINLIGLIFFFISYIVIISLY